MNEKLIERKRDLDEKFSAYDKAIKEGTEAERLLAKSHLEIAEKAYAAQYAVDLYAELGATENPTLAAIRKWYYEIPSHHDVFEDKVLTGVEETTKDVQLDLLKFCEQNKISKDWYYHVECLNMLMCIMTAKEMGKSKAELDTIRKTYKMKTKSRELVDTVSRNDIERNLQAIIDALVFEAGENGENIYKVYNKDVRYLIKVYTKKGSGLMINTAGHRDFTKTIVNIAHRIVTDGADYEIGYKRTKESE